jgi:pilus assembly protein CpaB
MPTRLHVSRRLLAAIAAAVLAIFGALVLISWVNNADARARAAEQLVPVLVATNTVSTGTAAGSLGDSVSVQQVPKRLAAPGSIAALSAVKGRVTIATLLPGEQLVTGRFADPATQRPAGTVPVPDGMVEISVSLEPQRAVGGVLKAGDKVGVQLTNPTSPDGVVSTSVFRVLHDVLVTRTQGDTAAPKADPNAASIVTLAVSKADATDVVRGATAKALWLSLEVPGVGTGTGSSGTTTSTTATFSTGGNK